MNATQMSPHGQFLLKEARAYMDRLIAKGVSTDQAAKKAADWFGFHPSAIAKAAA